LAAGLLREAGLELGRLERGGGEETLHDFRVALRRLRSVLRALRPWLGSSVRRKQERRLRAIARATTPARDAEVQLAWIARERGAAGPRELPGISWLERRLAARTEEGYQRDARAAAGRYRRLAGRMARRLSRREAEEGAGPRFGPALSELVRAHAAALWSALDVVSGPFDVDQAHDARIDAKRLRYLLEPLRGCGPADAEAAVGRLKELQEILGELHDAHVAADLVAEALSAAAAERARRAHAALVAGEGASGALLLAGRGPYSRGLLALDQRAIERARAAHARLRMEWLAGASVALAAAVEAIARELVGAAASGGAAPRRRVLLARLPGELARAEVEEVETGWLPGPGPCAWLRRVSGRSGVRWLRGVEGGPPDGTAIDEPAFLTGWPATAALRLACRRRHLGARGPGWWVDEIAGVRLVVAEGPPEEAGRPRLPRVLRAALVRDVTLERAYRERALAARQRRARAGPPPPDRPPGAERGASPEPGPEAPVPAQKGEEVSPGATAPAAAGDA
jgi:CHAD domain-containing protein